MESTLAHGIGVKNRYALFYDEDVDPLEILRQQEEEKQKRKTDKTQPKEKGKVLKPLKQASTVAPKKPVENVPVKIKTTETNDGANKGRGKPQNERFGKDTRDIEEKKNFRNRDDQFFNSDSKERDPEFRRGRGGFRGRGGRGDRGRGYFGNSDGRNRRVFDRHSGSDKTGVRSVDKREGSGPNNWGDYRGEISQRSETWDEEEFDASGDKPREPLNWADEDQNTESLVKDDESKVAPEEGGDNTKENEPVEESVEDVVKQMTLDEWKKEQEAKRIVPKYNLRKPGEGEDDKQWKKGYVLKKKPKEEDEDQDEDDEDDDDYARKGQQRQLLDIQINFSDERRGSRGRGRGGRGGIRGGGGRDSGPRDFREDRGRGGRGAGRDRGDREPPRGKQPGQQSAPRVDDFNDFPSLVNA
ncbi:plasminogen activator inhibitor 1 RNA-binding protein-like [Uloborus diversus]|uniref:plasminogen activator inhibitor 1 RNA-binding protein-like n=1 Tax=Uloborus diversus TaxID=327109 RepID=UPI00240A8793|nr:plasminogen activator inhibitor 1 RNA-binding protein-like [Uloborus diversus]